jgi:hypothetical protein
MWDVWNSIYSSSIIIADCTGRNPNVFYELGIAHTLGKPVILSLKMPMIFLSIFAILDTSRMSILPLECRNSKNT